MQTINDIFSKPVSGVSLNVLNTHSGVESVLAISFLFECESLNPVTFACHKDGESLKVERSLPEEFSMGEFGNVVNKDVENGCSGEILRKKNYFSGVKLISFEVTFKNGSFLSVTNWGDDLVVKNTPFITADRLCGYPFEIKSNILHYD